MDFIVHNLQVNIFLLLFLIIGLGHLVGKLKLGSIELGPTTGILIVGLVIGLLRIDVPPIVKGISFTLYLFVLGVSVGPGMIYLLSSRATFKYLALALFAGVAINEVVKDAKSIAPAIAFALPGAANNIIYTVVALVLMAIL